MRASLFCFNFFFLDLKFKSIYSLFYTMICILFKCNDGIIHQISTIKIKNKKELFYICKCCINWAFSNKMRGMNVGVVQWFGHSLISTIIFKCQYLSYCNQKQQYISPLFHTYFRCDLLFSSFLFFKLVRATNFLFQIIISLFLFKTTSFLDIIYLFF